MRCLGQSWWNAKGKGRKEGAWKGTQPVGVGLRACPGAWCARGVPVVWVVRDKGCNSGMQVHRHSG